MVQTSSSDLVSSGALLFGALIGAFVTILAGVATYTVEVTLTGRLISLYLGLGLLAGLASAVWLSRSG